MVAKYTVVTTRTTINRPSSFGVALYAYCPLPSLRIRLRELVDRLGPEYAMRLGELTCLSPDDTLERQ